MNDLEQYELTYLRIDSLIDQCEGTGHPYPTYTKTYPNGDKAVMCPHCNQCVEFIDAT